jgi:hypothetical protein
VFKPIPPSGDSFKIIQANINAANARLPRELQLTPDQLSAVVGGADKPYAGIALNEGANPHKVALPVQMAMQHYQQVATTPIVEKKSSIKTFFKEVQLEAEEEQLAKRQLRNQYAQTIAERVLMKENTVPGHTAGFKPGPGPGIQSAVAEAPIAMDPTNANNPLVHSHEKANAMHLKDRIAMARAQLRELAQLSESNELVVWERITRLSKGGMFMGLEQNLEQIRHGITELANKRKQGGVASRGIDKNIGEGFGDFPNSKPAKTPLVKKKVIKSKSKTSVCRAGQTQTGMQTKDGKQVPKCSVKPSLNEEFGLPFGLDKPVFPEFPYYLWWDLAADLGVVAAVYTAGTAASIPTVGASEAAAIALAAPRMMRLAKVLEKIVYIIRLSIPDVPSMLKAIKILVKMSPTELKAFLKIASTDGIKAAMLNIGINFGIDKLAGDNTEATPAPKKDLPKSASFANTGGGAATGNPSITNQKK